MDNEQVADCFYAMTRESVKDLFWAKLRERKETLLEQLVDDGGDEFRFKVQMIDEVVSYIDDLENLLKE